MNKKIMTTLLLAVAMAAPGIKSWADDTNALLQFGYTD